MSSIQRENVRLSQELQASRASRVGSECSSPARTSATTKSIASNPQIGSKSRSPSPSPTRKSAPLAQVVSGHEEELVMIANELT